MESDQMKKFFFLMLTIQQISMAQTMRIDMNCKYDSAEKKISCYHFNRLAYNLLCNINVKGYLSATGDNFETNKYVKIKPQSEFTVIIPHEEISALYAETVCRAFLD